MSPSLRMASLWSQLCNARGQLTWNASTLDVLYAEPDGGNCRAHCVTDQPLPAAIAAIRAEVADSGLAPPEVVSAHNRIAENHSAFGSYEPATKQGEWGLFVGDLGFNLARETMQAALRLLEACGLDVIPVGCGLDSGFIPCSLGYPKTAHAQARLCIDEVQRTGIKKLLVAFAAGSLRLSPDAPGATGYYVARGCGNHRSY